MSRASNLLTPNGLFCQACFKPLTGQRRKRCGNLDCEKTQLSRRSLRRSHKRGVDCGQTPEAQRVVDSWEATTCAKCLKQRPVSHG